MFMEVLITFWHWWALGGLLVIVEAFAPGFMFLWLGAAAVMVGTVLLVWPPVELSVQLLLFASLSLGSIFAWRRYRGESPPPATDQPHLNRRAAQYVGRQAILVDPIVNGYGRIKIGDASWAATGPDLPAGRTVEIVGADGILLCVTPTLNGENRSRPAPGLDPGGAAAGQPTPAARPGG